MPRASRSNKPPSIGLDIVEIARIKKACTPAFLKRVFSPSETAHCKGKKSPRQHFAVRFAATAAAYKPPNLEGVALPAISVARDAYGRPIVVLRGQPVPSVALSPTHSDHYAAAVAISTSPDEDLFIGVLRQYRTADGHKDLRPRPGRRRLARHDGRGRPAARGALRSGAGLVTVAVPGSQQAVVAGHLSRG